MHEPLHPDFFTKLVGNAVPPPTPTAPVTPPPSDRPKRTRLLIVAFLLVLVLSGATAYYFYSRYHAVVLEQTEIESAVARVGEHIMLPADVLPRVGKIANTEDFKDDPFLSRALVGDLVLFYPFQERTVKAILFRPDANKIVDVSLVTLPEPVTP